MKCNTYRWNSYVSRAFYQVSVESISLRKNKNNIFFLSHMKVERVHPLLNWAHKVIILKYKCLYILHTDWVEAKAWEIPTTPYSLHLIHPLIDPSNIKEATARNTRRKQTALSSRSILMIWTDTVLEGKQRIQ